MLSFIHEEDLNHDLYRQKVYEFTEKYEGEIEAEEPVVEEAELKPPDLNPYHVEHPVIAKVDMDIIKLTAQYVARKGEDFLIDLTTREASNPQFDFLQPAHALFPYFTSLVDAYGHCLLPKRDDLIQLQSNVNDKESVMARCMQRFNYESKIERQHQEQEAEDDSEILAAIDWHDFIIVETVNFDSDEELEPATDSPHIRPLADKTRISIPGYTQKWPKCKQMIPIADFANHLKLELMDPLYQKERSEAMSKEVYASGDDMLATLDRFREQPVEVEEVTETRPMATQPVRLVSEPEWARWHPGLLHINIAIPKGDTNYNINGQIITLYIKVTTSIEQIKEAISSKLEGLPLNKFKLKSGGHSVLKDEATLAFYNIGDNAKIDLTVKGRGGRRH